MKISILLLFCLFNVSVDGIGRARLAGKASHLARAPNVGRLANTGSKLGRAGNFFSRARGNPVNTMKNVKTHFQKKSVLHKTRGMKNNFSSRLSNGGMNSRTSHTLSISNSITSAGHSRNPGQKRGSSFLSKSKRPTSVLTYNSKFSKSSRNLGNQQKSRLQEKCKYIALKSFVLVELCTVENNYIVGVGKRCRSVQFANGGIQVEHNL